MNNLLMQEDIKLIESSIRSFEEKTGCELLVVHAKSADAYPGATWRFGLIGGLVITFIFSLFFDFHHSVLWPITTFIVTLFMVWVGHFAWAKKFALSDAEVNREFHEKAIEYFHTLGTSKVSHKVTAMIMVSLLEKRVAVLVDEKLKSEITQEELNELVDIMTRHFKAGNMAMGFVQSIESLEQKILKDFNGKVSEVNPSELADQIHFV